VESAGIPLNSPANGNWQEGDRFAGDRVAPASQTAPPASAARLRNGATRPTSNPVTAKHFIRVLTLLALLLAPFGMLGGHAAMAETHAAEAQAGTGHCADMAAPAEEASAHEAPAHEAPADGAPADEAPGDAAPTENVDCTIACSCVPTTASALAAPFAHVAAPAPAGRSLLPHGLGPRAELPPPRLS